MIEVPYEKRVEAQALFTAFQVPEAYGLVITDTTCSFEYNEEFHCGVLMRKIQML